MSATMFSSTDLQPVTLVLQEIQTVTSSMRRNQRWASSSSSFATSAAPLPPSLRRGRSSSAASFSRKKGGGRASLDNQEGDLMDGFVELRRNMSGVKDITSINPLDVVTPFLSLIRSPLTSGPITSLALTSLNSLITSILPLFFDAPPSTITPSTSLQICLAYITSTLSQCRFPSSSPQSDELVLLRLLRVIESLCAPLVLPSTSSAFHLTLLDHMGDESVCELLEVGLGMLARARLSDGLRNAAQSCVQTLTRTVFMRLKHLAPEQVDELLRAAKQLEDEKVERQKERRRLKAEKRKQAEEEGARDGGQDGKVAVEKPGKRPGEMRDIGQEANEEQASDSEDSESPLLYTPYGLPTVLELLRVLIALLDPSDQAHTDSMRLSALAILNTALEVGGTSLGKWPELREGVRDEGCRYLFQLTRSDSPSLLAQSLRTTSTLFSTLSPHLKLQLELFLSYVIDRLASSQQSTGPLNLNPPNAISRPASPAIAANTTDGDEKKGPTIGTAPNTGPSTPRPLTLLPPVPAESRELILETLTQIALRPSFMVDCWINYDCSTDSEDIFERLIDFLTRGVYPAGPPKQDGSTPLFDGLDSAQLLCLETLLSFVSAMASRLEEGDEKWSRSYPTIESLNSGKARKAVFLAGAAAFNTKPRQGIAYLEEKGVIAPDDKDEGTPEQKRTKAIARFLKQSSRLDKKLLGDYISRPDQIELLTAFIKLFDFRGKSVADAMRELLETFRLPGEAQPIARITEVFAEHFFSFKPPGIADQDAIYVLAYSVIMLNTDLHNPQNRKRMTIDDYKRNLRGVNGGKDFDPEYLASIHESLRKREIILPEEHAGQHGFDYAWKSLMLRSRTAGPMIICNTASFDEQMFSLAWRKLISSIAYAFTMSAQDEHVIQRAITGFRQCASLAAHFRLPEVFDTIVQSLSSATGLLDDGDLHIPTVSFPSAEKDGQTLIVSPLSIRFGQSYRSQLATVVLFTIANSHASAVREGWLQIFEMFQTLFLHRLLPGPMLQMEDFLAGTTTIPMKASNAAAVSERRSEGGGLLSTLSSYLLSPYGSSTDHLVMEASDEDVENTLVAVDCLSSCKLEDLYGEILKLELDALLPALRALRALAEARTIGKLANRQGYRESGSPTQSSSYDGQLPYDPACVFHLETMVSLASRGKTHIAETWPILFEFFASLLGSAQSYSVLVVERAVVGLLRLCLVVSENPAMRDQLYLALDVLRSLPSTVLNAVSEQLMAGVARILEKDSSVVRSQTEWGLIIALFRATVAHPEASKVTLSIVQRMATGKDGLELSADNFGGVVALLDEFATAAGAAAAGRQQQTRRSSINAQTPTLGPTVERGLTALDSLYELRNVIPELMASSKLSEREAWNAFWLPPLLVIGKQCVNTHREIRQRAVAYLQRFLLSSQLLSGPESTLPTILDRVLFPVLDELLKPQAYERDPHGMAETRLRSATLLCKVFLQYVVRLVEGRSDEVGSLFVRVLDKLERLMRGERDLLSEAGESLKNVVLVMHSSGLLVPPPHPQAPSDPRTETQKELWNASVQRIERVLPGFLGEAIPAPLPPPPPKTAAAPAPEQSQIQAPAQATTEQVHDSPSASA
ncbi:putative golgi-specific brefeldin a-resistance guanine nucleotide exchange factor 1 [Kockovaella imperatae]|uniref:Putative golgi-specific brefeldin a-resistance guanine nucleotide exchange factor 1 n=1 Tax=Kockovaella imperatae TaxID=4999 RepID=A0A1Y1U8D7_9TREE|nr:putative golgi-specific brefeldin a-resistance guanine nucleotide exchange factor 1 [Kockovaella imperatae]ORX34283.1 putative golgi-specific brefeldin a-resistance guanine nucleotide exchange factor 1 [Kockovaella imperatae]